MSYVMIYKFIGNYLWILSSICDIIDEFWFIGISFKRKVYQQIFVVFKILMSPIINVIFVLYFIYKNKDIYNIIMLNTRIIRYIYNP